MSALVFPTPVLTPITGCPTNSTLQVLQRQLYQNARAIPSDRGGGALGHLAVIMEPDEYILRPTAIAFVVPHSPGALQPAADGTTQAQLFELKRVHTNAMTDFILYQNVRTALVNQISAAVEPTFLEILCDVDFGFADVEPYTLLTHLKTTYGTLTGQELENNRTRLSDAWDTTSPIETLWFVYT